MDVKNLLIFFLNKYSILDRIILMRDGFLEIDMVLSGLSVACKRAIHGGEVGLWMFLWMLMDDYIDYIKRIWFCGWFNCDVYGKAGLLISACCSKVTLVCFVLAELDTTHYSCEVFRGASTNHTLASTTLVASASLPRSTPLLPQPSAYNIVLEEALANLPWIHLGSTKLWQQAQNLSQNCGIQFTLIHHAGAFSHGMGRAKQVAVTRWSW